MRKTLIPLVDVEQNRKGPERLRAYAVRIKEQKRKKEGQRNGL